MRGKKYAEKAKYRQARRHSNNLVISSENASPKHVRLIVFGELRRTLNGRVTMVCKSMESILKANS
jgi:hypothetical protein